MKASRSEEDCPADLIPTRSSLLGRLKNWEDQESWRTFFDTYWRLIYNFARQRELSHEEAQEVVQETVVAVAKHIGRFHYDGQVCAFKTWLMSVTRSKIANLLERRARRPAPLPVSAADDSSGTGPVERVADERSCPWEESWEEEWRKNLMENALQRVKRRVAIEQYQMFDLFVVKQWPAREVARTLHVTTAHVYVAKHRITKLIRQEVETLERQGV